MKTLRVTVQLCLLLLLLPVVAAVASASTLTLSGNLHFPSLDGSAQDSDGLADGTFTVDGDLVLEGTIHCNDAHPLPQGSGACPIRISVTGGLTLEPGSEIFAENRRGNGNGGDIELEVGGDLTLRGPEGSLSGAVISTSQVIGTGGRAGALTAVAAAAIDLQAGSILAANSKSGNAGAIAVTGESVLAAGLIAAGPSRTLLPTPLSGEVLDDGSVGQAGGTIHLRALGSSEPGLRIDSTGIVVSQGEGNGGRLILLEACGIEVRGLVASLSRNNGPSQVVLRSGKGILVDGRDLGTPLPAEGRFGRIRADGTQQGAAGYLVDLFAESDIQVLGPDPSSGRGLFAVTSRPGDQPLRNAGGTITAISLSGSLTATGNAFETGRDVQGDKGGTVDLQARGDVTLDDATIRAVGGFTSNLSPNARAGGHIDIRSFQGAVSWTFGVGDVRPTGTGVPVARRGTIEITACTTADTTGTQFPVLGSTVLPFPVETEGVCSPIAPSLPEGEPPLPTCAPANQPPAPSGGPFSVEENSAVGTVVGTVSANDPDPGQTHTFSIFSGNTGGAFAIHPTTGEITVNDSDALDFETTSSFSLVIRATDSGVPALFGDGTVIVTLTNRNEAPTDLSLSGLNVYENAPAGTLVGNLSTVDPDTPDSHTYSLVSGDGSTHNGAFQISGNQLQVLLPPNYEAQQALSVRVRTTDAGGLFYEEAFTITVIDINEPPTPVLDNYSAFGNTQLVAGGLSGTHRAFSTDPDQVDANDTDPDTNPGFRNLSVVAASGMTSKGGSYSIDRDGKFTYQPPVGYVTTTASPADPTGPDTFSYSLSDGTNIVPGGEVRITVNHRIWYVHNSPGTAGNAGDSADPVDTLAEAETKSGAGDYIYVFEGNGSDTGMDAGITLKDDQKLIGERFDLVVAGTTLVDGDGTRRPEISDSNDTVSALANTANGHRTGIEIRGLQLSSTGGNAIDLTSADAANLEATIHDVVITGTGGGQEGIDVNAGSTGTATLAIHDNTFETLGTAIDVQRTAGTAYIKAFNANAVSGDTAGTGINVAGAIFDAVPGGAFDPVSGGVTVIGAPGNGVGQAGMVLTSVQGSLSFQALNIFADNGAGLRVSGTGSGMTFGVMPGAGLVEAAGGPAVDIAQASIALPLSSIKSTNSPTTGLALNNVTGNFSAGSESTISNITSAAGTAFQVGSSNATIDYAGTISTNQGKGVDLTGNAGSTIALTGTLTLSTGASAAFNATGGGTVTATDTANTLTSTTGTALNAANTTIGVSGLKFRSISAGNGGTPANGIFLDSTGTTGSLTVTGTDSTALGGDGSGGTIQNATGATGTTSGIGVYVRNARATLRRMHIRDSDNYGIFGTGTTTFDLEYSTVDSTETATSVNGDSANADDEEGSVAFEEWAGTGTIVSSVIGDGFSSNLRVLNTNGADLNRLTVTNSTFNNNGLAGNNNIHLESRNSGSTVNFTLQGSTIKGARADWVNASNNSNSVMDLVIGGNTFSNLSSNAHSAAAAGGNRLVLGSVGTLTYDIVNNTLVGSKGEAIRVRATAASGIAGTANGTISGNDIGLPGTPNSGSSESSGIFLFTDGGGDQTALVTNNEVYQYNNHGIRVDVGDEQVGTSVVNVTITNNIVDSPGNLLSDFNGIHLNHGTVAATDDFTSCVDIRSNDVTGSGNGAVYPNNAEIRLRQRQSTTVILPGYAGLNNEDCSVIAFVAGQNTINNSGAGFCANGAPNPPIKNVAATTQNATTTVRGFESGASCAQPD